MNSSVRKRCHPTPTDGEARITRESSHYWPCVESPASDATSSTFLDLTRLSTSINQTQLYNSLWCRELISNPKYGHCGIESSQGHAGTTPVCEESVEKDRSSSSPWRGRDPLHHLSAQTLSKHFTLHDATHGPYPISKLLSSRCLPGAANLRFIIFFEYIPPGAHPHWVSRCTCVYLWSIFDFPFPPHLSDYEFILAVSHDDRSAIPLISRNNWFQYNCPNIYVDENVDYNLLPLGSCRYQHSWLPAK